MNSYILNKNRGNLTSFVVPSDYINAYSLGAGTGYVHSTPTDARFVTFKSTTDFYAKPDAIPTLLTGAVGFSGAALNGSAGELNPTYWELTDVTGIGIISRATNEVTLSFYKN